MPVHCCIVQRADARTSHRLPSGSLLLAVEVYIGVEIGAGGVVEVESVLAGNRDPTCLGGCQ